jgi:hypothetical protein
MFIHRFVFAVAASVLLMGQGFVTNPSSRTSALSSDGVTLQGFVEQPGQTVTIQAVDHRVRLWFHQR